MNFGVIIFDNGLGLCSYTNLLQFGWYWIYLLWLMLATYFPRVSYMNVNNLQQYINYGKIRRIIFGKWSLFNFVWAKLRTQNKTLKVNYSCLLITLVLVHIKYTGYMLNVALLVHAKYTGCLLHVALLVHIKYTICTLHVALLVHINNTICTLHVTDDANILNCDCRQGTYYYSTSPSRLCFTDIWSFCCNLILLVSAEFFAVCVSLQFLQSFAVL